MVKNSAHPAHRFSAEVKQGDTAFLLQLSYYNKCLFHSVFRTTFGSFLFSSLVISLFKMGSKQSAELLASVSKCKKDGMCLMEKIHVLDQRHSGVSYSAVAMSPILVNQQHILYKGSLNIDTQKTRLCIDQLTRGSQEPNPLCPLRAVVQYLLIPCLQQL